MPINTRCLKQTPKILDLSLSLTPTLASQMSCASKIHPRSHHFHQLHHLSHSGQRQPPHHHLVSWQAPLQASCLHICLPTLHTSESLFHGGVRWLTRGYVSQTSLLLYLIPQRLSINSKFLPMDPRSQHIPGPSIS